MERRHRAGALHKNCLYTPMWVKESRTGSKAQRSDRVRIERHKLAEATWTADECYSTWTRSLRYASLPVLLCGRPPGSAYVDQHRWIEVTFCAKHAPDTKMIHELHKRFVCFSWIVFLNRFCFLLV